MEKGYALITGASQGLGRAIALQIAERGYGIIAVARTRVKLEETAAACRALNGGRVRIVEADLTAPDAISKLAADVISFSVRKCTPC